MGLPNRIVLVRHGESIGNIRSVDDNSFDDCANHNFELTKKGRDQVCTTAVYLNRYGIFDSHFVSTFKRTQETMQILAPYSKPIMDSRLNELWRGIWHTMHKSRVDELYPDESKIFDREGWFHYRPPGGQSCQDLELMIYSFYADLREMHVDKNVLISAHGNWMILFWRIMLNTTIDQAQERYKNNKYNNAAIAVYENRNGVMELVVDNLTPWQIGQS